MRIPDVRVCLRGEEGQRVKIAVPHDLTVPHRWNQPILCAAGEKCVQPGNVVRLRGDWCANCRRVQQQMRERLRATRQKASA